MKKTIKDRNETFYLGTYEVEYDPNGPRVDIAPSAVEGTVTAVSPRWPDGERGRAMTVTPGTKVYVFVE